MERLQDRFYGLVIGGALADSIGTAAHAKPKLVIQTPLDVENSGIKPGYWMECTSLYLCLAQSLLKGGGSETEIEHYKETFETGARTSYGAISNVDTDTFNATIGRSENHQHNTGSLVRTAAVSMYYFDDYMNQLKAAHDCSYTTHKCLLCADACKLFSSIIDGVLHGRAKGELLNPVYYGNLQLSVSLWDVLTNTNYKEPIHHIINSDDPTDCIRMVLYCFKNTNNFHEGLKMILEHCTNPSRIAVLYGQLAGAFYGLTDIKMAWVDTLQTQESY